MIAAGKAAKKKLMIGYRCHFEPYNVKAMELMREGAVGRIRTIRAAQHYNMGPTSPETNWRVNRALAGGGPLEDYGIYGVQSALYLAGEAPAFVSAHTTSIPDDPRFAEIFAHVATQFKFPSGAVAQLSTSYNAAGLNNTVVHGETGILDMEPATGYGGQRMTLGSQILTPGDPSTQFAGQMDHFANAVRDNATIKTGGAMGLRDVRLMEAIYKSAAEKATIALAPDGSML
jgi:predicted dehydrogenase